MLIDGIHVMLKGKYIGPEKPGPWSILFEKLNINVFKLGPLFAVFGIGWLIFLYTVLTSNAFAWQLGILLSALTLWYLPVGTAISMIILVILLFFRNKAGI